MNTPEEKEIHQKNKKVFFLLFKLYLKEKFFLKNQYLCKKKKLWIKKYDKKALVIKKKRILKNN